MIELKKLFTSPRDESPSSDGCSWVELPRVCLSSQDAFLSQDSEKSEKKNIIIWLAYPFKWGCLIFFNIYSFVVCVMCTCEHIMVLTGRWEDHSQESVLSFSHRVSPGAQTQGRRLGSKHLDCWANSLAPGWDTGGLEFSTSIAVHTLYALQLQHMGAEGWHVHVLRCALWTRNAPHSSSRAATEGVKWPGNPSQFCSAPPSTHLHTWTLIKDKTICLQKKNSFSPMESHWWY